ncbi:tetratricopeptide repeat protein [Flavobacterium olei]|uniref:tetratricopeptide repeat protein n=1 Tax=Flavobacterium olei TaxID=1886782 RepID=UPI00321A4076
MNVTDYTYLMNKPDAITEKQADALGSVLNEFPYFQSARALRLKGLYNQNSFKYNYALKVTAAHTADRSVLFDFITSEAFTSIQNDFYEQKLRDLLEIKVFDSEIISPEQIKKALEVKVDPVEQSILNSIKEAQTSTPQQIIKTEDLKDSVIAETLNSQNEVSSIIIPEEIKTEEPEQAVTNDSKDDADDSAEEVKTVENNLPEIDPSIFKAIMDAQSVTYEESVKIEEPKAIPVIDESYFTPLKEAQFITYERPVKEEEKQIDPIEVDSIEVDPVEDTTFDVTDVETSEEETKIEEIKIDRIENSILSSIKVAESPTPAEPLKIEEQKIDSAIERSILSSIKEAEAPTSQESKIEESKTETIAEQPVFNSVEEDEDDSVIEEMIIPEFKLNIIEPPAYSAIKETEPVISQEKEIKREEVFAEKAQEEKIQPEIQTQISQDAEQEIEKPVNENVKTAAEHLEIGKPLDFSLNEKHSFQEWLQLSRTEPIDRSNEGPQKEEMASETVNEEKVIIEERQKKAEIIDKFIETNPKISPIRSTSSTPAVQIESNSDDNSYLMTETLARVYLEQKKYTKAIQAYEILILKYPEKITFFADRISDIKILQQNNNNNN